MKLQLYFRECVYNASENKNEKNAVVITISISLKM